MASNHSNSTTAQIDLGILKGHIPLVGLTGGIGSGKTLVSDQLGALGAGIIDTDLISHEITASGGSAIPLIKAVFGLEFIDATGALNRLQMRKLVFKNPDARQALEGITHPLIRQETAKRALALSTTKVPYLVFSVPLLIESGTWIKLIDYLVVVDCPKETQIERVMQRNNLTRDEVEGILNAQASREERLIRANAVIENQGDLDSLNKAVLNLHQKLLKISYRTTGSS
ncbi:dephospho-CoA kinase [Polynucleobacter sp. TUM22923]|jgi:dephospho-CoA kinase|uniref:dephospho-CoA kinase n=1 Tax=Polynucleobacter sp. TUM22923 TaxID=3022126 RepID=UPI002572B44C|nr:dephospho-CoA kinase [Polynucleobacter sp. TUM22923]BDX20857.1 dephospho-CoA kinase [Polynucleobacter sp. TUM22923]